MATGMGPWHRKAIIGSVALLVAGGWTAGTWSGAKALARQTGGAKTDAPKADEPQNVEIVFRSGNKIEGLLLSETSTSVRIRVTLGTLSAETEYQKSEILSMKKLGTATPGASGDKKEPVAVPDATGAPPKSDAKKADPKPDDPRDPNKPVVYVIKMRGEFGRDVSATPITKVVEDAKKWQPDVLVLDFDQTFSLQGEESSDWTPVDGGYDMLEQAREIATLLTDKVRDDAGWKTKPRLVSWVKKALGGAAFLPFIAPEIYYSSDGRHGGIGYLETLFGSTGDEVVREKQYSLRLGRAEGMAALGGHDTKIMRAMSRTDYVLSVKFVDGRPVFLDRMPESADELLLTDDGKDANKDIMQDIIRYRGNDALTLDAATAVRIGLAKDTADTLDELMFSLGYTRGYVTAKSRGDAVLEDWGKSISKAEQEFYRLWREHDRVEVRPPGEYRERTAARGQRKRILLEIAGLLDRYKEAINPRRIRGAPENWVTELRLMIDRIEQEQRLDRP